MTRLLGTVRRNASRLNTRGFRFSPPAETIAGQDVEPTKEHSVLAENPQPIEPPVRIVASRKRRRTVTARMRAGVLELLVPASMPISERNRWAEVMDRRLRRRADRTGANDERLEARARLLNDRYFGGRLRWRSIHYAEMKHQWGSCTFAEGAIRIASRAARLPEFVIDYLLMHELAHLEHSGHGPEFHELENRFPLAERARGYLLAVDHGWGGPPSAPGPATAPP